MEDKKSRQPILVDIANIRKPAEEAFLPLWLVQHGDLINAIDSVTVLKKNIWSTN